MPIQVQLPSGRVTTVDTDDPKVAAATARAFVVRDPYESARAKLNTSPAARNTFGSLATLERQIPFLTEAGAGLDAGLRTLGDGVTGKGLDFGKNWTAARATQQADVDAFAQAHPVASNVTKGLGLAAPIAAAILSGGATAPASVEAEAPGVTKGVGGFLKGAIKQAPKSAVTGGATAAAYGASQPGTLKERLQAADAAAPVGAVLGTVVPPLAVSAAKAVGNTAAKVATTVTRAANKATGGALLDASQTAASRLVESLKADGATPDLLRQAMNGYLKNGATDPTLIDIASRLPSGGQNTLALVRAAAAKGSGRGVAQTYADKVAADLQDKAIDRTRALTPDTRPANVVRDAAVADRRATADVAYAGPKNTPVDATSVLPALDGDAGHAAISGAYKDADALRDAAQMDELDRLRKATGPQVTPTARVGGDELPATPALAARIKAAVGGGDDTIPVSLGTLDRTKIALNEAGQAAAKAGNNSQAAGLFQRAAEIDDHLANVNPDYAAARDGYARSSAGIDALDHGATGLMAHPDEFEAALADLRSRAADPSAPEADPAGAMAGVGYRQALTDAIGAPTEGATGTLNKVSTSTNQGRNLEATFGPEGAAAYRAGLKDLVDQLANARTINPNTGSATAMRLADLGLVEPNDVAIPKPTISGVIMHAVNKIRAGATLTDAEREMIARIGTLKPDISSLDLADHLRLPPPSGQSIPLAPLMIGVQAGEDQDPKSQ